MRTRRRKRDSLSTATGGFAFPCRCPTSAGDTSWSWRWETCPAGLHGLLARVVRQHFSSLRTLEETRIKARFDERIIRSMSSGFIVLLPDTTIMHVNPEGERILGYRQGELIGRRLDTVLTSRLRVLEVFRTGKPIIDEEMVIRVGNRPVRIIKTAVAVFDDDGKVVAVMDLFKEIKEVHRLVTAWPVLRCAIPSTTSSITRTP